MVKRSKREADAVLLVAPFITIWAVLRGFYLGALLVIPGCIALFFTGFVWGWEPTLSWLVAVILWLGGVSWIAGEV